MSAKILIGADIVPTKSNVGLFEKGDRLSLIGEELDQIFTETDFIILNLEVPLTDKYTPIIKAGAPMLAPVSSINGLKAINNYFFGLANNHIFDQGEQGLYSTIHLLEKNHIAYAGAGATPEGAAKPYITNINGIQIGIYACAEHEYSIVSSNHAGANPYDPLYSFDHVMKLKEKCDLVIVLYHGGKEYYRYPSPNLQRVFHKFAEVGADVIIAQHTHCIGCKEIYKGALLVYGQGNFLFDNTVMETGQTSLLIEINTDGKEHKYSFIPIEKKQSTVQMARDKEGKRILDDFLSRSKKILEAGWVDKKYSELAEEYKRMYLSGMSGGYSRFLPVRAVNKLLNYELTVQAYKGRKILPMENFVGCEAHRELVLRIAEMEREKG